MKWLLTLFRWGLCIAAVWFLYHAVSWQDKVNLGTKQDPHLVQLIAAESDDGPFVIEENGVQRTVTIDEVYTSKDSETGQTVADVRYGLKTAVKQLDYGEALLAILIFGPVPLLSAQRLIWMLLIQRVSISFWVSAKLTYAGNFFNFALPGSTGGDLIKAYYLAAYTHRKTEAVTTVFLDRVMGLLGLVLLAGTMLIFAWNPQEFGGLARGLAAILIVLMIGASFVFSRRLRHAIGLPKLADKLPAGQHLLRIGRTFTEMRSHKGKVVASLIITMILQFLVMLSVFTMARALQMQGDFAHYLIYLPIVFLVGALPIAPPQGLGVVEAFCVQFFGAALGNSLSQAFTLALAIRLIQLVWALPGVLVPLFGAHVPNAAELDQLEEIDGECPPAEDFTHDAAGEVARPNPLAAAE